MDDVWVGEVDPAPTLVVPATTTWSDFPELWPVLLGEVWACQRAAGVEAGTPNIIFYRDDTPTVEVGVAQGAPVPLTGRVITSQLPGGRIARLRHRGAYAELGRTHRSVHSFCASHGLSPAGPRWEWYGPHRADPADVWVDVSYVLA